MTQAHDIAALRHDFPLIANRPDLVYLDSAATTQKPQAVLDAITEHYRSANANVHRAAHALSGAATEAFEAARSAVARRVHAESVNEIVWTKGTTEAINLVAASYAPTVLGPGDNVVITRMEHHSNIVPWQVACERTGAELKAVDVSMHGIDQDDLAAKVDERTRIVAVAHVSNVPRRRQRHPGHRPACPPGRRRRGGGRCPGHGASRRGRGRTWLRLLCLFGAQDVWPHRHRCAVGTRAPARADAAPGRPAAR